MKSITFYLTSFFILLTFQTAVCQIPPELLQPDDTTFFQISNKVNTYYINNPIDESEIEGESEGGEREAFKTWEQYWANRLGLDGTVKEGAKQMSLFLSNVVDVCETTEDDHIDWRALGPFNSDGANNGSNDCQNRVDGLQNQGRIDVISVNPDEPNKILAGSPTGGIWRTIDGGMNWSNVTDDEGYTLVGISGMVRHPENPEIVYASTGTGIQSSGPWNLYARSYGIGIIMSINDGVTWQPTGFSSSYSQFTVSSLAIDPQSTSSNTIIYAGNGLDLYRWVGASDASGTWTSIFLNSNGIQDIEIESNGTVWVSTFGTFNDVFRIPLGILGAPTLMNIPVPNLVTQIPNCDGGSNPVGRSIKFDITRQDHIVFVAKYSTRELGGLNGTACVNGTHDFIHRTTDSGLTWQGGMHEISTLGSDMAVSRDNSGVIYCERDDNWFRCIQKYTNCFQTTPPIQAVTNNGDNHVDVRFIGTFNGQENDPNGDHDVVYLGTDGGLSITENGFDWVDITGEGLACSNFNGVGITETNSDYIFTGAQDGSINFYNEGSWFETPPAGDNGDVLIDPNDITRVYQQSQSSLSRTIVTGNIVNIDMGINPPHPNPQLTWLFPMLMNPINSDEIFAGRWALFSSPDNGDNWNPIPPHSSHAVVNDNRISSVAMSANNSDVVYYSIRGYWHATSSPPSGSDNFGAIYKADRSNGSWDVTNITNDLNTKCIGGMCGLKAPISDIGVDPNNEDNIWVTLGSFSDENKVFKTTDGGDHWVNVSNCLPNIPMTAVVVQGGTNNRVYVGSDYGVFYKDDSMTDWAYYGNNGPRSLIYDMEINYCGNKIVVATQGRGLWEADLINSEDDAITLDPGTTDWTTPRSLYFDHIVPDGATLNITGTEINIAKNVRIIVEKGARLNIDNSVLTNGCGDLWQGIEVQGTSSQHQFSYQGQMYQGLLNVEDSRIEYARNAVKLGKKGDKPMNHNGGIVIAKNTTFRNNKRAVEFLKYRNFHPSHPSITFDNSSSFTICTFITDEDLPDNETPTEFVKMGEVDNVKYRDCDFMNINPNATKSEELGRGIYSLDASFSVTGTCTTSPCPVFDPCCNPDKSEFINLEHGVLATNNKSARSFKVDFAYFENCRVGVQFVDVDFAQITRSEFEMEFSPNLDINTAFGIINDYGTQYRIEDNSFTTSTNSTVQTIGTVMVDVGADNNEIYKNSFENMFIANWAYGDNGALGIDPVDGDYKGLAYFCNEHTNSRTDIAVSEIFGIIGNGIRHYQGTLTGPPTNKIVSAGNTFSNTGVHYESDILNQGLQDIIYYYDLGTNKEPLYNTPYPKVFATIPALLEVNTCPSSWLVEEDPKDNFVIAEQNYIGFKEEYDTKIDNGNTANLLTAINDANNNLKDILIGASPYLSVNVLVELINTEPLSEEDLYDVLVANPDVLRQPIFKEKLSTQSVLSVGMLDSLFSVSSTITDRGKLEMSVSYYKAEMNKYARDVVHLLLSLPDEEKTDETQDELLLWMETNQSLPSMYNRIDYLKSLGQDTAFSNILSVIPTIFNLSEKENLSYQSVNEIYTIINQLEQDDKNEWMLNDMDMEYQSIETLAEKGYGRGKAKARNIMGFFYGKRYPIDLEFPDEINSMAISIEDENLLKETKSPKVAINLIPNPASNELNIQYISPSIYGNTGEILIVNLQGQELFKGKIDAQNKNFLLNVNKWDDGMYYCIYKPTSSSQKIIPFIVRHDN